MSGMTLDQRFKLFDADDILRARKPIFEANAEHSESYRNYFFRRSQHVTNLGTRFDRVVSVGAGAKIMNYDDVFTVRKIDGYWYGHHVKEAEKL